jgi:hypothetical protein
MPRKQKTVELSDGTVVTVQAPGIGFELEATGALPALERVKQAGRAARRAKQDRDLDALREAEAERDRAEAAISTADETRLALLAVCWGAIEPRIAMEPRDGYLWALDILPADVERLAAAVHQLREAAIEEDRALAGPSFAVET